VNEEKIRDLSRRGSTLREKIDLHIHTSFSDGNYTIDEAVKIAEMKGIKVIGITDHYSETQHPPGRVTRSQFSRYLKTLNKFSVLKGVEVEILQDGTVSITKNKVDELDFVIGGLHSLNNRKFWGDSKPIWDYKGFIETMRVVLIKAIESGILDVIAHVSWFPETIRKDPQRILSNGWIESVVDACCDGGVVIELNSAWKVPDERFVKYCVKNGVQLAIGSDAHERFMIGKTDYAVNILKKMKVPDNLLFLPTTLF
jgi:histidinol phosphatase-like PHP family hydrolase